MPLDPKSSNPGTGKGKRDAIAIVIGKMGKAKGKPADEADPMAGQPDKDEAEEGSGSGLEAAMQELGEALKAEDWKAAAEAFKSACELVHGEPEKESESADQGE